MFSVIIPVYNKENYVKDSIESVLNQNYADFELIIVNDNSTDNSLAIIENIKDERITIINRKERGYGGYAARNIGINKSKYEYVAFLDADDIWNNNFLSEINKLINKFPDYDVFSTAWEEKNANNSKKNAYYNKHKNNGIHSVNDFYLKASLGCNPVCTISIAVKKNKIIEAGLFPQNKCKRGGDIETWMRLMLISKLVWSPYIGAVYNKNIPGTVTKTISDIEVPHVFYSSKKIIPKFDKKTSFLIKKYVNYYSKISILHSIIFNINKKEIIKSFYKEVDKKMYMFLKLLSFLPSFILKPAYKTYRKLMLKFSKSDLG